MSSIISWILKTALGRWVTGGLIILILGSAVTLWHSHKEGLRDEGRQECIQKINQSTVDALEAALAQERAAHAELRAIHEAALAANKDAVERRKQAEKKLENFQAEVNQREQENETYAEWRNTPLPDGVASGLRELRTGDN